MNHVSYCKTIMPLSGPSTCYMFYARCQYLSSYSELERGIASGIIGLQRNKGTTRDASKSNCALAYYLSYLKLTTLDALEDARELERDLERARGRPTRD